MNQRARAVRARVGLQAAVLAGVLHSAGAMAQDAQNTSDAPAPPATAAPTEPPVLDVIPVDVAQPKEQPSARAPESVELDEVIVTSQKTKQTLREVPASVSAISGEAMRDSKILTASDVNGYVPNAQLRVSPFAGELRIRGYGTSLSNVGFEPSVGLIIDDVYYGRTSFMSALMYDVDRLEVIRGPQGALFGKNTVAGVVNITTIDADNVVAGDITVFARDDNEIRDVRGGVSVPLADGVYSRLSGAVQSFEGLFYNTTLDRREADLDSFAGRAKLRITDLFGQGQLRLAVSSATQKANGNLFQLSKASDATLALFKQYDPRTETNPYNSTLSSNVPSKVNVATDTASAAFDYPFGEIWGLDSLSLTSVSAYAYNEVKERTIDFDFSPVPVVRLDLARPTPYDQYSQELRLSGVSPSLFGLFGRTEFIGGVYYLKASLLSNDIVQVEDLGAAAAFVIAARGGNALTGANGLPLNDVLAEQLGNLLGAVTASPLDDVLVTGQTNRERAELLLDQDQEAIAAYGQVTTYLTEHFAGILGWRIGHETKDAHLSSQAPAGAIFIPAILGQSNFDTQLHRAENESSPKVGVKYDFSKKVSSYLVWAKGYKGGGYNALPFNDQNLQYGPETADTYETGIKARLFDNTLDANFAAYLTNFNNLQVSVFDGTTFNIQNAAEARSQGFEADFRWLSPFPGTSVRGTLGYCDAYYRSYPEGPAPADSGLDSVDLSGRSLVSAPKWSASLIPQLSLPGFGPNWGFQFQVEGLYTSKRYLDVDLDPNTLQKATLQVNARVSVGARDGAWSVSVFGSNLTNEGVLAQVTDEPVAPGNFGAIRQDRGREFYGAVKLNF
ncbi:MAG: TonB-dependent receptor [Hydrocarboniphaga sp.]|uniref:TonB-dependent receptor n=1 Tax=Hydrocarboniphaga sp. TaxID=2033016 RepID=UPI0026061CE6|nr:TonB-dependent receptor [Hydrocarboniphaga sp.]MDB5969296.1 TonB-dependent receptor [Hydrocarboniphaga sp.]